MYGGVFACGVGFAVGWALTPWRPVAFIASPVVRAAGRSFTVA
nr:MAG TPA: hypothetical protein [Caudoviricetes sp.]